MRNIVEYPITFAEKISVLRAVIEREQKEVDFYESCGDMTVCVLQEIMRDLHRFTAKDEEI